MVATERWVGAGRHTFTGSTWDDRARVDYVQVQIDSGSWAQASGRSAWSYTWDVSGAHLSEHTLYARAVDQAGNVGSASSITFTLDLISPTATITNVAGLPWLSGDTFLLRSTAGDSDSGVIRVEVNLDGLLWDTASGTTAWPCEWDLPEDGIYHRHRPRPRRGGQPWPGQFPTGEGAGQSRGGVSAAGGAQLRWCVCLWQATLFAGGAAGSLAGIIRQTPRAGHHCWRWPSTRETVGDIIAGGFR